MPATPFHARLDRHSHGVEIVDVAGEVDMNTATELGDVLAEASERKPSRLIVDLTKVGFIDSMGLSVLVRNAKVMLAAGASFEIVCADKGLMQVFELTGLDEVLTFHPSRAQALLA
jgi:anti-sigma B factor antagonist